MSHICAVVGGVMLLGLMGCGREPAAPQAESTIPDKETPKETSSKPTSISEGTKAGDVRKDNWLKLSLVWCPSAEFLMGSPTDEVDREDNEGPVRVTLAKGFWLGQTEVTQGQWSSVMQTEPWMESSLSKQGSSLPVTYVDWANASDFCRNLTEQERDEGRLPVGWEYRLPTEAEWEYACRAGTTTPYSFGDRSARVGDYAWYEANTKDIGKSHAQAVGLKKPNPWGLFDMHGNVWEWCGDWYAETLAGGRDPGGPPQGIGRVIRGGSWDRPAGSCRSALHTFDAPSTRFGNLGFRVALAPVREAKTE